MSSLVGFTFKDGKRVPHEYNSLDEKLYCECEELCDQQLWEEAKVKLDERFEKCGHISHTSYRKIQIGLAMEKGASKKDFQHALEATKMELSKDGGSHFDEILDALHTLLEHPVHQLVKMTQPDKEEGPDYWTEDYEKTEAKQLLEAAQVWFIYPTILKEVLFCGLLDYGDAAHDQLHCIMDALAKQGNYKMAYDLAVRVYQLDPTPSADFSPIFLGFQAECAKLMGKPEVAHSIYKTLTKAEEDAYHTMRSGFVSACPAGSLTERIERTRA